MTTRFARRPRPVAALVLAGVLWGTSDAIGKIALQDIPPITLAALRFAVALATLWPLMRRARTARPAGGRVALLGLLGIAAAFLLQNAGLTRTGAANASMLQGMVPILVAVGAALFLREKLDRSRATGLVLALGGVVTMTLFGANGIKQPGVGDLSVLASAVCFAAFFLIGRPLFRDYGTIPVLTGAVGWALVVLAPLAVVEMSARGVSPAGFGVTAAGQVIYLGVGCSALTYLLWGHALTHLNASQAVVYDNLIPIIGLATAALLLHERPSPWQVVGGLSVVLGAHLASRAAETTAETYVPAPESVSIAATYPVLA